MSLFLSKPYPTAAAPQLPAGSLYRQATSGVLVSSVMGPPGLNDLPCRRFVSGFRYELHGIALHLCARTCMHVNTFLFPNGDLILE